MLLQRFVILCTLMAAAPLSAQVNATGTISGQVTDPAGAGVPNAAVKVTETNTGISVIRNSGAEGYYTVPFLKPGVYSIEVSAAGFSTAVVRGLSLDIQQVLKQNVKL